VLNISVPKIKAIEASIVNFLPRIEAFDRDRWQSLLEAIDRTHGQNTKQEGSGKSVHIGITSLRSVKVGL
jgi:hypothetical protein